MRDAPENADGPTIETARLRLAVPTPALAPALLDYHRRNRARLRPIGPTPAADVDTLDYWVRAAEQAQADAAAGAAARFALTLRAGDDARGDDARVIGGCNLSNIIRGPLQQCFLGYHLDGEHEGRGLMSEAVAAVVDYAFQGLGLHRVCANYEPTNARSAALLRRAGFVVEGFARDYLFLDGAWRDHVLTARIAPPATPAR